VRTGFPITAVGTNLHVRRAAYDQVGGFEGIPFSVTEDYALFNAVTSLTDFKAKFPLDRGMLVESLPSETSGALYNQKKRWFVGGIGMAPRYLVFFLLLYLAVLVIAGGIALYWQEGAWKALVVKIMADFGLLLPAAFAFRKWQTLRAFPLFELYFTFYVLLYPPIVLVKRGIVWKDRQFQGSGHK
jgi:cellulose synthase/poly-beta-1,6-N-acetylglucosamine synthase-like glycosyltransferase